MQAINKVVCVGTTTEYGAPCKVYCKIVFKDGRLSITGVEGPMSNGNAKGGCGQIRDFVISSYAEGWDKNKVEQFRTVWNQWHLNDMRAGTPAQEAELSNHVFPGYPKSYYEWAKEVLTTVGLQPDNGYSYGSKWLMEEVPEWVILFLASLPDSDTTPAWV